MSLDEVVRLVDSPLGKILAIARRIDGMLLVATLGVFTIIPGIIINCNAYPRVGFRALEKGVADKKDKER
jgi:hypothetical protein